MSNLSERSAKTPVSIRTVGMIITEKKDIYYYYNFYYNTGVLALRSLKLDIGPRGGSRGAEVPLVSSTEVSDRAVSLPKL